MQIRTEFMVKNRTDKIIHLPAAYPIRPKIRGEVLQVFIHTGVDSRYGLNCLPAGATVHISIIMMIKGFPARVRGKKLPSLAAVLAVADDEGNEQRVRVPLKPMTPELDIVAA